jgi:hypothetical protein
MEVELMSDDWFKNLKPGDVVFRQSGIGSALTKDSVDRITPSGIVVLKSGARYREVNRAVGANQWDWSGLREATVETVADYEKQRRKNVAWNSVKWAEQNIQKMSDTDLRRLIEVISGIRSKGATRAE